MASQHGAYGGGASRHSIDRAPAETALSPDGIVRATSCGHVDGALTVGGQKAS